jgi:predicted phosphodiesterase
MRQLLLSDIHSNMEAFDACMARARRAGFDYVLCCGDIVGYGPEPNEAVALLRGLEAVSIRGNHDRVACGQDEPLDFNPHAKAAAYWTRLALNDASNAYLRALPVGPLDLGGDAQLVHGAITDEDDYLTSVAHAAENFDLTDRRFTFFGHTHFAGVFSWEDANGTRCELGDVREDVIILDLKEDRRYLVNPGSVGQPRDGDPRAGFAIWDVGESRLEFYRVAYPFEVTQEKMRRADLSVSLIDRLQYGR